MSASMRRGRPLYTLTLLLSPGRTARRSSRALYYDAFAADTRPTQAMDAMTMLYISTTPVLLVIALRFISPTQMVYRPQT